MACALQCPLFCLLNLSCSVPVFFLCIMLVLLSCHVSLTFNNKCNSNNTLRRYVNIDYRTNITDTGRLYLYSGTHTVTTCVMMAKFFFEMQKKTYSTNIQTFRQSPQPLRLFSIPTSTAWYVCKTASIMHTDLFKQPTNEQ